MACRFLYTAISSVNAPLHSLLPTSTTPTSTQRLAQKDPSRKPRVGPNMPEDLTRPVREGRQHRRVRKMLHGQAFFSASKERGEEGGDRVEHSSLGDV